MGDAADLTALLDELEAADDARRADLTHELAEHPDLADAGPEDALRAAVAMVAGADMNLLPAAGDLSRRALQGGLVEAGRVYAVCVDRMSLLSGRPQRYGTVTVEHQGEMVMPPVDPATTDQERAALGIPPIAELVADAQDATRRLATARAESGEFPPGQPFVRIWRDVDPAELRARRDREGQAAWADGDELTFVCESVDPVAVTPVFQMPTWDAGDGLQVLQVKVDRLAEAVITYTFTPRGGAPAMSMTRGSHDGRFRGADAPVELPSNEELVGTLFEHVIESSFLGEPRKVSVYVPPREPGEELPVVYATDGNMFAPYARRLDAAMEAGACPRVVFVAAHSAPMGPQNNRALEYLPGFDDRRFDAHQRFFVSELADWAEAELDVATDAAHRGIFGCSDGGGHTLATAMLHPDRFAHAFAYSTGMPPDHNTRWGAEGYPMVHLSAGTLEGAFHLATQAWAGYLSQIGAPSHFSERVAGHDLIQWAEELPSALRRAWGTAPN